MHLILANGTQLNHIGATGETRYIGGKYRDSITFEFNNAYSVDELRNLFTEENCEVINIITDNEDGTYENNYHYGYVNRIEASEKIKEIEPATGVTPAVTETRIFVTMAQRVYEETQYLELKAQNEMLSECILEMSAVVYAE